jgi:hypothetical protein
MSISNTEQDADQAKVGHLFQEQPDPVDRIACRQLATQAPTDLQQAQNISTHRVNSPEAFQKLGHLP